MSRNAARPAARSLPLHGLPGAPHSAAFAGHTTIAGTNRRDFLQNLKRQLFDRVESFDIVAQSFGGERGEP